MTSGRVHTYIVQNTGIIYGSILQNTTQCMDQCWKAMSCNLKTEDAGAGVDVYSIIIMMVVRTSTSSQGRVLEG